MKIQVIQGDITAVEVDAIVNAANTSLLGGGGVDGAIHRKGGKAILDDCVALRNAQGGCKVGEAVITTAGNLPAKYVIHTVGPRWNGGAKNEAEKLTNCYLNSLKLAVENGAKTVAFPSISTGIYGYPKEKAAEVVFETMSNLPSELSDELNLVIFVCFDTESFDLYERLFVGCAI